MGEGKEWILSQWYWMMPNSVLFNKGLTDKQKLLFCLVSSLCAEKWYCRATNEYLWELLNASKITISKNISVLVDKWLIYIEVNQNYQRKLTLVKNDKGDSQKWQGGDGQKWQDNITTENITNENKENSKRKWYGEFKKCYLTDEQYQRVLEKYWTKQWEYLIKEVDNYCASKWKKYDNYLAAINTFAKKEWIKEQIPKKENESWIYDLPF